MPIAQSQVKKDLQPDVAVTEVDLESSVYPRLS